MQTGSKMRQNKKVKQSKRRNAQKGQIKIEEIKRMHKVKEIQKKLLTKGRESGRIVKLSQERWQRKKYQSESGRKNF